MGQICVQWAARRTDLLLVLVVAVVECAFGEMCEEKKKTF